MQLGIVGFFIWVAYGISERTGEKPNIAIALIVGFAVAAIATGIVAKLLDWSLAIRAALSRLVGRQSEPARDNLRLPRSGWTGSDGAQEIPRARINENLG
jgi:hypothetical protein